jgi:hypothetical protein
VISFSSGRHGEFTLFSCYRKKRYSRSDTTLTQPALLGVRSLPQDLLLDGPKNQNVLQNPLSGLSNTHNNYSKISLNGWEIEIRNIANSVVMRLMSHDSPNPDAGQLLTFTPFIGASPYREITTRDVNNLNSKTPNPDGPIPRYTCGFDLSTFCPSIGNSGFTESQILMPKDLGVTFSKSPITHATYLALALTVAHTTPPSGYRVS